MSRPARQGEGALIFIVPGPPVPWQRVAAGRVPPKTRAYKLHVATCALAARSRRPWGWNLGAAGFEVELTIYRLPAKGRQRRGDGDNIEKSALDAMTKVLWLDDSQVRAVSWRIVDCAPGRERLAVQVSACGVVAEDSSVARARTGARS